MSQPSTQALGADEAGSTRESIASAKLTPLRTFYSDTQRAFVIRGDLRSNTGYGKATQTLALLLNGTFEVYGVDLHPNPVDASGPFPYPVISDTEIPNLIRRDRPPPVVLNYTTPDTFKYFPGVVNIGSFYWETDLLPRLASWPELIESMDHMWAPTSYVVEVMRNAGYNRPVSLVTWPHETDQTTVSDTPSLSRVSAKVFDIMQSTLEPKSSPVERLRRSNGDVFLAVQSLAPRKGLPVLLSEWRDYVNTKKSDDILLLKLRFIHSTRIAGSPESQMKAMLYEAGFRNDDRVQIALVSDHLSETEIAGLYTLADAYITATYGEGFGGPVAEALQRDRLVIAPRHTGIQDLLAPDYPFAIKHVGRRVGLRGNSPVYPFASLWNVPEQGAVLAALQSFSAATPAQRSIALAQAKAHLSRFCSVAAVQRQLLRAVGVTIEGGAV